MVTSTFTPDREAFRQMLATLAAKTKTKIPALNGRVEKALRLVLAGDVELHDNGTATVYSSSDPTRRYEIIEGTCTCQDWDRAPEHLCQHRLSAGLVRRTYELLPPVPEIEPSPDNDPGPLPELEPAPAPLPEARASINVRLHIGGRECQLTLRDSDEARLLQRLQAVLVKYPLPQPPAQPPTPPASPGEGWCAVHQVQMKWNEGKDGRKGWFSHRTDEGWCKGH